MGLRGATYDDFRTFLRRMGCEEAFDRAFYLHNDFTALDPALWEACSAEHIIAHAFDWRTTPEGRPFWHTIDTAWNRFINRPQ